MSEFHDVGGYLQFQSEKTLWFCRLMNGLITIQGPNSWTVSALQEVIEFLK